MMSRVETLLTELFDTGAADVVGDRPLAVALYRAARARAGRWEVDGYAVADAEGDAIYVVTAEPPLCDGGCGDPTPSPTGMCYQCQCEAHAEGWYNMDTGYVRMETDAEAHRMLERS